MVDPGESASGSLFGIGIDDVFPAIRRNRCRLVRFRYRYRFRPV